MPSISHSHTLGRYLLLVSFVLLVFVLRTPIASALAYCVTNPYGNANNIYDARCAITVGVTPSATSISYGGNTNVTLTAVGFIQSDSYYTDFYAWMIESGTGTRTDLSYSGGIPSYNGATRTTNTGALTKSVTVYLCATGSQGPYTYWGIYGYKSGCASASITVAPPPVTCTRPSGSTFTLPAGSTCPTWTKYCTPGNDVNGNNYQEWAYTNPLSYTSSWDHITSEDWKCKWTPVACLTTCGASYAQTYTCGASSPGCETNLASATCTRTACISWISYCTGGADINGNNWQIWKYYLDAGGNHVGWTYVEPGTVANSCVPSGTWSTAPACPTACGTAASTTYGTCSGGNGYCSGTAPSRSCSATAACPTGTWTAPTCPTACGTAASTPSYTCVGGNGLCATNSPATKSCAATAACPTGTWTAPTCPTACGTAASTPSYTCVGGNGLCATNSPATKSCAATASCATWSTAPACSPATPACGDAAYTTYATCSTGTLSDCTGTRPTRSCAAGPACPSGSISASPNPCTIAQNAGSCTSTITWSAADTPSASVTIGASTFSSNKSGSQSAPWIGYTAGTFILKDSGGNALANVSVSGTCISGTTWNPSSSSCVAWVNYCTGGADINGNNWQIWKYYLDAGGNPVGWTYVTAGTVANSCVPSGTWTAPWCPSSCFDSVRPYTCQGGNGYCSTNTPATRSCTANLSGASCPTGTWTEPTCPTACGTTASTPVYTCVGGNLFCATNSPATKSCAATVPCDSCGTGSSATPLAAEPTTGAAACGHGAYANSPADVTTNGSQAWRWSCGTATTCTAPKYGCTTATDTTYNATGPNNIYNCALTCANGGTNYPTCTPVAGTCGTANGRTYANGSSSYSPYTQCGSGTASVTSFPTAGNTTTWTCSGTNGGAASGTCSASQTANPVAILTASPNPVAYRTKATLNWSSTNATSCTAGGAWSNASSPLGPGSGLTDALTSDTTFTYQCFNGAVASPLKTLVVTVGAAAACSLPWSGTINNGESVTAYLYSSVIIPDKCTDIAETRTCDNGVLSGTYTNRNCVRNAPATIAELSASPSTIISVKPTSRSTLTWSSKNNATSCYPSAGEGVGFTTGGATSGTFSVKPASTSVYEVKCTGPGGDSLAQTTVTVINPSATIISTRSRVLSGSAVTLTWSSSQVTSCAVSGPGLSSSTQSGSQSVTISSQSTYTITCQTVDTPVSSSVTVNVAPSFQEF